MNNGAPRVAVVMITYNRREQVLRSLGHLTRLPERPRLLVVDNGSTDGTAAAVAEHFPQVEVLPAGRNLGAAGRTLGARHVDAPYVAFADDDNWWAPGSLGRAVALFDAHPRLGLLNGRILVGPEERPDPACAALAKSPLPAEPGMPGPPILGFLAGGSVVRRSAYLQAGGFHPRFGIGGEEGLLAADLTALGWWVCYVPDVVVHHHPSARQRDPYSRHWHMVRNGLWLAWLRRPLPSALRHTASLARLAPRVRAVRRGLAAALAGLPWVLPQRRVLPRRVEQGLRLLEGHR
jgi:GT2 family glycosyltransferase